MMPLKLGLWRVLMTQGKVYDYKPNSGYKIIYKILFAPWKEMLKDMWPISNLPLGSRILDHVFLLSYTFLSDISVMFYFDNQEKWNKSMTKRDKIEGGVNVHLMRKKKGLGSGRVVMGQDYKRDLKDSDDGQMLAAQNSPCEQCQFQIFSLLSRLTSINIRFQSLWQLSNKLDPSLWHFKNFTWFPPFSASKLNPSWSYKHHTLSYEKKKSSKRTMAFFKIISKNPS